MEEVIEDGNIKLEEVEFETVGLFCIEIEVIKEVFRDKDGELEAVLTAKGLFWTTGIEKTADTIGSAYSRLDELK